MAQKKTKKPAGKSASASSAAKSKKSSAKSGGKSASKSATGKGASKKAAQGDIINLILEDHKPLKRLIKIMKDSDNDLGERQAAFEEFCPLLVSHAKPEEQTLYVDMKDGEEMREDGFEGDVEHQLADQMIEEAKRTVEDVDLWSARVKVLAELVEHHIKEEEEEMLPDFRKNTELEERIQLGEQYLQLRAEFEAEGGDDAPSEKGMKNKGREDRSDLHS